MILAFITLGYVVSNFTPMDPRRWYSVPRDLSPSISYLLGTTTMGRDVFWELCWSIRNSMLIGLVSALIATHIGLVIGLVAGMKGGFVDRILMFFTDTFVIIPGLPLLIVVITVLRDWMTIPMLGVVMSAILWPRPARQVRAMVLSLRERPFIDTARLSGMNTAKIIVLEILPFMLGWHMMNFINILILSIGLEGGLGILGLSLLGENTLGVMVYWALNQYYALWRGILWWIASPLAAMILLFVSLYLTNVGLNEYLTVLTGRK